MEKIFYTGVIVSFCCLMGINAQIQLTPMQGGAIINTRNLEPHHVDVIDGVAKLQMESSLPHFVGSPYLDEEFKWGTMKAIEGTVIPGLKYRYNIYNDRMEFIINQDTAFIDLPLALEYIQIEDRKFQYEVFQLERNRIATGYFEILYEGDFISALCQRQIKLEQDAYSVNYGGGGGTKDFMMKQEKFLYMKPQNSAALEIERKKDFYRHFPEYEGKLSTFIKENKISLKREDDFYKTVEYIDRLIKGI